MKVKNMKLVTNYMRCRPNLGADYACKSLYRFKFVDVFMKMWVPHSATILKHWANQSSIESGYYIEESTYLYNFL